MKKTITSFLTAALAVSMGVTSVNAQTAYPYFATAEVASDITTVATTVANPATALVDISGDFTAQFSGTAGQEIKITNSNFFYAYTPAATGDVRFVKRSGTVYVYEGTTYKGTITAQNETITYPTIADADIATSTDQMLTNASFETTGGFAVGTSGNELFGTPWVTNVTMTASGGIRVQSGTTGNVNGTYEVVWRGSGNTNYFAQPVTGVEANKSYKVITNQIAGGNATANFNVGLGTTVNGLELAQGTLKLGNGLNGVVSTTFTTPLTLGTETYFTFKNTATNTASSGSDPVTQLDYITLVEGVSSATAGITGTTGSVYFVNDVFAPQITLNTTAGDYYDMVTFIANPSFEVSGVAGWTNNTMATQTNADFAKVGNVYCEKWVANTGNLPVAGISQALTGLPNGSYKLKAVAHAIKQGADPAVTATGAFLYAGTYQTQVSASGEYEVANIVVADGTLTIGFKTEGTIAVNWVAVDNFRLSYYGPVLPTKVDDANATAGVSVYPTLTKGNVNVDSDSKDCTVTVLDLTGKVVSVQSGTGVQAVQLNKTGIYLIKTECEGAVKVTKVCKTN